MQLLKIHGLKVNPKTGEIMESNLSRLKNRVKNLDKKRRNLIERHARKREQHELIKDRERNKRIQHTHSKLRTEIAKAQLARAQYQKEIYRKKLKERSFSHRMGKKLLSFVIGDNRSNYNRRRSYNRRRYY